MSRTDDVAEFTRVWQRDAPRVMAYARRHVAAGEVQDVVAETFLQAWQRWHEVPEPPIAWLLGAARKVIANLRRAAKRRASLHDRLVLLDAAAVSGDDAGVVATERVAALEALAALPHDQREALLLTTWDGLSTDEAAVALGVRAGTLRVRAHRARRTLAQSTTVSPYTATRAASYLGGTR